ncbi:MAG: SulP family inorganic anion transporter [Chitinophagales bacterium]|nr:SulP family inorganic anion transporter [Chitinophagales bacterium]
MAVKRKIKYYRLVWLKHDLPAGMSVFFVALPLCLGIALASGAPLYAGLMSGIIGGLVVSFISGSKLSVSGPAAGLSTIVAASIISLGDYRLFLLTVIIGGLFQLLLGILRLGALASYFPSSVIKGMLAAIGIILISKQIPLALGYDQPDFWTSGFLHIFSSKNVLGSVSNLYEHTSRGAVFISVVSLLILILMQQPWAKNYKIVPIPLLVVVFGIIANLIFEHWIPGFSLKKSQLVNIPSNIFENIVFPDVKILFQRTDIWQQGLVLCILATLETLLCIEAVDKLDKQNRITPVNRELIAQGIGNIFCGMLGAIPITAVVVRGAANADAGARTKLSAFTHGLFLLLSVLLIPFVLSAIPYACLAAILLSTGYNLAKPKLFRSMWALGLNQFLPFVITIIVILSTDLLIGVGIGLLISIYFIIQNNFKAEYKIIKTKQHETEVFYIKLNTNVTFLNKVNLKKSLDTIPEYSIVTIDGSECNFIDHDILEIISEYENKAHLRHIVMQLKGIKKVNISALH